MYEEPSGVPGLGSSYLARDIMRHRPAASRVSPGRDAVRFDRVALPATIAQQAKALLSVVVYS